MIGCIFLVLGNHPFSCWSQKKLKSCLVWHGFFPQVSKIPRPTKHGFFSPEAMTSGMTWGHAVHTFLSMRHVLLRPDTHPSKRSGEKERFFFCWLPPPKKRRDFEKIRLGCGIVWGWTVHILRNYDSPPYDSMSTYQIRLLDCWILLMLYIFMFVVKRNEIGWKVGMLKVATLVQRGTRIYQFLMETVDMLGLL